jgi:hypothetical protein
MSTGVEEVQSQPAIVSSAKRLGAETAFVTPPVIKSRPQILPAVPAADRDIRLYAELILFDTQESCCKKRPLAAPK